MKSGKEIEILGADPRQQKARNSTGSLEALAYGQVAAREFLGSRAEVSSSQVWRYISAIPALGRLKENSKLEASPGSFMRHYQKVK